MAGTNGLIITSIALWYGASSLRLQTAPVDLSMTEGNLELDELDLAAIVPLFENNIHEADARDPSLRLQLDQMLKELNMPVVYFIGDSLVRNQWEGMCFLIGDHHDIDFDPTIKTTQLAFGQAPAVAGSCANDLGTMVHSLTPSHSPEVVDKLLESGAPQPDAIYWDAAMWTARSETHRLFEPESYKKSMHDTIDAYTKAAPRAKLVFFLSHCTCKKGKKHRYKAASPAIIKNLNDMALSVAANRTDGQGRPIRYVDGYSLTQNKCDMTPDGRHYNTLVLDEVNKLFRTIQDKDGWKLPWGSTQE